MPILIKASWRGAAAFGVVSKCRRAIALGVWGILPCLFFWPNTLWAADAATYLLVWKNTATGAYNFTDAGESFSGYVDVLEQGSEVIHVRENGSSYVFPVNTSRQFERDTFSAEPPCTTGAVNTHHEHQSYTDPRRWTGVKGEFTFALRPQQRTNGVYYLDPNIIYDYVALAGFSTTTFGVARQYTLLTQNDGIRDCGKTPFLTAETRFPSAAAPGMNLNYLGDVESTNGLTYHFHSVNTDHSSLPNSDVTIEWDIQVRKLGKCAAQKPPLLDSDPLITSEDVKLDADQASISPDGNAKLTVTVTCDGVVVENAPVEVTVKPKENSGGHVHQDSSHPRPRGYLKKPGASDYTKLTEDQPSVTVKTGAKGTAVLRFRPGRDTQTQAIGISGLYDITAKSVRFPDRTDRQTVTAEVTGLSDLGSGTNYSLVGQTDTHPENHYATPSTAAGLRALAKEFQDAQIAHNATLKPPWPTNQILVNDISLVQGGLFDVVGYDIKTGQFGGTPWHPPHYDHLLGVGVDINKSQWSDGQYNWLVAALKGLGNNYGSWVNEPTLHLNFSQGAPKTLETFGPLSRIPLSSSADVAVTLFQSAPTDHFLAAPGQTITLVASVDNLHGTEPAHNVELSVTLPPGLTFLAANPTNQPGATAAEFRWPIDMLPAGALPFIVEITARVNDDVAPGSILATRATATTADHELRLDNNNDAADIVVPPAGPDMAVDSNIESVAMTPDHPVSLTLVAINVGNALAPGATLRLTLPDEVTLQSSSLPPTSALGGKIVWQLGNLAPDASQAVSVSLSLAPSLAVGAWAEPDLSPTTLLTFAMEAECEAKDVDARNNLKSVTKQVEIAGCDLSIWADPQLTTSGPSASPSQQNSYTIGYASLGNQIAVSNTLTVSLSAPMAFVSAQPPPMSTLVNTNVPGTTLQWSLPDLAVGQSGTVQLNVDLGADGASEAFMIAAISSATRDIHPDNNTVYLAGPQLINTTAPDDSGAALTIARAPTGAVVSWLFPGLVLESTTNLMNGLWLPAIEVPATNGPVFEINVPTDLPQRYFRMRQP